ncbi:MAG: hypothetical protein ACYCPT_13095, partial [Acidimicrobiales bacterium]
KGGASAPHQVVSAASHRGSQVGNFDDREWGISGIVVIKATEIRSSGRAHPRVLDGQLIWPAGFSAPTSEGDAAEAVRVVYRSTGMAS